MLIHDKYTSSFRLQLDLDFNLKDDEEMPINY